MKRLLFTLSFLFVVLCVDAQVLMILGGRDHDVFLGNLNTNDYDSKSIWNEYGTYGNSYSSYSIWNEYGTYGSEYSQYSPFNEFASCPPVIVDSEGNFYGYFTANEYKNKRCSMSLVEIIIKYHELIAKDVDKWYEKIFE